MKRFVYFFLVIFESIFGCENEASDLKNNDNTSKINFIDKYLTGFNVIKNALEKDINFFNKIKRMFLAVRLYGKNDFKNWFDLNIPFKIKTRKRIDKLFKKFLRNKLTINNLKIEDKNDLVNVYLKNYLDDPKNDEYFNIFDIDLPLNNLISFFDKENLRFNFPVIFEKDHLKKCVEHFSFLFEIFANFEEKLIEMNALNSIELNNGKVQFQYFFLTIFNETDFWAIDKTDINKDLLSRWFKIYINIKQLCYLYFDLFHNNLMLGVPKVNDLNECIKYNIIYTTLYLLNFDFLNSEDMSNSIENIKDYYRYLVDQ